MIAFFFLWEQVINVNHVTGIICGKLTKNQQHNFSVARQRAAAYKFNSRITAKEEATSWQMKNAKRAAIIKDLC